MQTLRTGVAGASGYAGAELVRILLTHPHVGAADLRLYGRADAAGQKLVDMHPLLADGSEATACLAQQPLDFAAMQADGVKLLFLATPHEQSREWAPQAMAHGMRVVDLSGAWRLRHSANRAVYRFAEDDAAAKTQEQAVYGSPELHADCIRQARLVANPGCYATSIILALSPVVRAGLADLDAGIICDAKSGVSGAGKAPTATTHFMHAANSLSAYGVFGHRHTGELVEQLGVTAEQITFTPHLLPIPRGILSTCYVRLHSSATPESIESVYRDFYKDAPLVRWRGTQLPHIQWVTHTPYCDLGFALDAAGKRLIVVSCLDNLLKGAASQAVENMNLMFGFPQQEGL